jgi:hypothetical protein
MDAAIIGAIEAKTGIKIDGEITIEEAAIVYKLLKPVIQKVTPQLKEAGDAAIDVLEGIAMKRKRVLKAAGLGVCAGARIVFNIPDDDDNTEQF